MSDKTQQSKRGGSGKLNFMFLIGLAFTILVIVFAVQNAGDVEVKFFRMEFTPPVALLIIGSIVAGSVLTMIYSIPGWWRRRKANSTLKTELQEAKKRYEELAALRPGSERT